MPVLTETLLEWSGEYMDGESGSGTGLTALVALVQGAYYLPTGIWPLVHMRSFEWVTGPKVDRWLVNTVGVLIAVIGGVVTVAGRRGRVAPEIAVLGAASAAGLAAIDLVYVRRRRIRPVYLLDAVAEIGLVIAWAVGWVGRPNKSH